MADSVPVPLASGAEECDQPFEERTAETIGPAPDLARVTKARDFDGDGDTDTFVGATY